MHLRLATPADALATASLAVDSFWNDELYAYVHPRREQYPDDFRGALLRSHQLCFWSSDFISYIAVTDEGDEGHLPGGRVVGYAAWQREGKSAEAKKWRKPSRRASLKCLLLMATEVYKTIIHADKSLSFSNLCHYYSEATKNFSTILEMWKLQDLCVHVDFQRRGVGSMLLDWGKEQAQKEGCPIGLESSKVARPMYLKNGFREYGTMLIKDSPLGHVPTYIWEPKGMEGKWGMGKGLEHRMTEARKTTDPGSRT